MLGQVLGAVAAVLTMFSFVPQIIKVLAGRSAKDVSIVTLFQLATGVLLWIIYGFYRGDLIIITANFITLSSLLILIALYYRFERK